MKIVKIGIFETSYSFFLFLLINSTKLDEIYFYFKQDFKFLKKIKNKKIIDDNSNKIPILLKKVMCAIKIFIHVKKLKLSKCKVYGQDHIAGSEYFRVFHKFYLLEDGLVNYSQIILNRQKIKNKKQRAYGLGENIQKIYLTGLAPIPKEIAHKVEIVNLKELWDKKSLEEQNEILDIFSFDLNIKEVIKDRDIILFTQPLSEDGIITEEEKIEIYSKIIKKYSRDKLIIKTHPREKTSYKEIFKDNLVLDNPFPFEILNLLDAKFNKAVTLFSTAALGLGEGVEVDFYGTEVNHKILARFGSCDNIMKRNSYLEEEE